jgi:chaperone modulatory protein CbpM
VSQRDDLTGTVLDEKLTLTVREVCEFCGVEESVLIEMVNEGVVEPLDEGAARWRFSGVAVARVRTAQRLQRDLHVNLPGAALALDLLEEIRALKARRR